MKILQWILTSLFGLFLLTSCKKDKAEVNIPAAEVAGVYLGKYGTGSNTPSSFYSFSIYADGTMQEINSNGQVVGTGTWTINGNVFRASYHYLFPLTAYFVATGTYDATSKKITGTWGYGSSESDGGKWHMTKQ